MLSIDWKWPNTIIFCVVAIVLGGLVYVGKMPPATMSVLLAWLIPSPLNHKADAVVIADATRKDEP